ncbi:hypothetical protein F4777DRAFT_82700 [Nemania sp. FL0916]|nr:hypothetical protein F4777DRAFT_82700 [Nemania sp. FL0916]
MSTPADNPVDPGSIINQPQHSYSSYTHPHPLPLLHPDSLPQCHSHPQIPLPHGSYPPHDNNHHFGQVPPLASCTNNPHPPPPPTFPTTSISTYTNLETPFAAVPSAATLVTPAPPTQDDSSAATTVVSQKLNWNPGLETSARQGDHLSGTAQASETSVEPYDPNMRFIRGPLEVLDAEQYDDGGYLAKRRLARPPAAPNPKKRGRKAAPNEQAEPVEEVKRARGRPRLETSDNQDMKERRKEQIRKAQRAYRERKDDTIKGLEAKVDRYKANNNSVYNAFQSLVMEYVGKHIRDPELGQRLRQFQAQLSLLPRPQETDPGSDKAASDGEDDVMQTDVSHVDIHCAQDEPASLGTQQPQPLFGGIFVTHELQEPHDISQDLVQSLCPPLEDGDYTFVRMPTQDNASFSFFLDSSMQGPWSMMTPWDSLPLMASGAYLERTLGRRLHRRTTEKAAKLLGMENPPYQAMHRVFGFVRNYASLEDIRHRVLTTLDRTANEDMDAYGQPFHHVGGSGTHFASEARTVSFPGGAPFPNAGFGIGPFDEKTMSVRDQLLDELQNSSLPGWQGEWIDSYEVEQFLEQSLSNLPRGEDGFVDVPPGDFYENPLDDPQPSSTRTAATTTTTAAGGGRSSSLLGESSSMPRRKRASDFGNAHEVLESMPMHPHSSEQRIPGANGSYPSPVSSIEGVLSYPAVATDIWPSGSLGGSEFPPMPQGISPLVAYPNPASLGFADSSHSVYPSPSMNQVGNKKVWLSVDKFIESLGSKATCTGRGPAFRKKDVVLAFWEAVKSPSK